MSKNPIIFICINVQESENIAYNLEIDINIMFCTICCSMYFFPRKNAKKKF